MASEPRGIFLEGTVVGTPFPGTVMMLDPGVAPVSGEFSWEVYSPAADGDPRMWAVLYEDMDEGQTYSTAYTTGARCFLYVPIAGEYLNMLVAGQPGTGAANVYTIGERFIVQHNTGLLVATSTSSQVSPFMGMEAVTLTADTAGWVWCQHT